MLDDNEYVDLAMGFGANLFGHSPGFLTNALLEQIQRGMPLGPHSPLVGKVAARICQVAGLDRVAFCNSGTEAVMIALRLAWAADPSIEDRNIRGCIPWLLRWSACETAD